MNTTTFQELAALLPRGDAFTPKKYPSGLSSVASPNPRFVEPNLEVIRGIDSNQTSTILVSAPGAVGKSTLAAALANQKGALLWDLSTIQVGSNTFAGAIMEAYDFEATGVLKRLRTGEFLFVLDAFDEAQVRAGSQNFDAFIGDLADEFKNPRTRPTVVLLARSDTADWIHLVLDEKGVPLAHFQIANFDKDQAESFINKSLKARDRRDGKPRHQQQAGPYVKARDALFDLIYGLFDVPAGDAWSDHRVRTFLGYAPVLEALADYMDLGNYMALLTELQAGAGAVSDPWQFLAGIIEKLLEREHGKVQSAVRGNMESTARNLNWSEWGTLYSPEEQCTRILGHSWSVTARPKMKLPPPLANQYEELLRTILPQHPFLRGRSFANVVFREYLYAWAVISGSEEIQAGLRKVMRDRGTPFLPSQLFSRFFVSLQGDGEGLIDGQDFGVFYESLLSRTEDAKLSLVQMEHAAHASINLDGDSGPEKGIEVELMDTGSGVHLWRRIKNAYVDVDARVELGFSGQRFLLGPAVDMECREFAVLCEEVDVDARDRVTVRAASYSAAPQPIKLQVRNEEKGGLFVDWPGAGHPWAPYQADIPQASLGLADTSRGDALRKFIMMFRRQRTRREQTLRNSRWSPGQHRDRDELLDLALAKGVVQKIVARNSIEFNSDYDSLQTIVIGEPRLSEAARQFVSEYLGAEQSERILGARP